MHHGVWRNRFVLNPDNSVRHHPSIRVTPITSVAQNVVPEDLFPSSRLDIYWTSQCQTSDFFWDIIKFAVIKSYKVFRPSCGSLYWKSETFSMISIGRKYIMFLKKKIPKLFHHLWDCVNISFILFLY